MNGVSLTSKGEWKIIHILKNSKIKFEAEKTFKDLNMVLLRYDFFLYEKNIIIEFNGEQHYKFNSHFFKTRQEFLVQQERDRRKIGYANAHGMKIYCIPYWELDNINKAEDLFQKKFLAKSKFHNDIVWRNYAKT